MISANLFVGQFGDNTQPAATAGTSENIEGDHGYVTVMGLGLPWSLSRGRDRFQSRIGIGHPACGHPSTPPVHKLSEARLAAARRAAAPGGMPAAASPAPSVPWSWARSAAARPSDQAPAARHHSRARLMIIF